MFAVFLYKITSKKKYKLPVLEKLKSTLREAGLNHPFAQILIAVLFVAFFAQIEIVLPINKDGIPITGQTFAVLLAGYFLGWKKGILAMILYLVAGVIGLPVLAGGAGGYEVLFDDSVGFLFGFIFGAGATGYFGGKGWGHHFLKCLLGMTIGSLVIIACGLVPLTINYGLDAALKYGFYPFVWGAIIKTVLGATIPPIYYNLIQKEFE